MRGVLEGTDAVIMDWGGVFFKFSKRLIWQPPLSPHSNPLVGGSLLTIAFQILVNNLPTAKLTMESVKTVNDLISCTTKKIKAALRCDDT
ncbi:hypothetical protein SUGI_0868270 [Cryptomeria japonica]|nr:hypothetical protein SUGI_0868270 [Cryptomeria japonica]